MTGIFIALAMVAGSLGTQVWAGAQDSPDMMDYETGWLWCQGATDASAAPATRFRMTCGPAPGQYTYPPKEQSVTENRFPLTDVVPGAGKHTCTCHAVSASGEVSVRGAPPLTVVVSDDGEPDLTPPVVEISTPQMHAVVARKSKVPVVITAVDESALVSEVTLFVNRKSVAGCTLESPPFACVWTVPAPPGRTYTLQAQARDASGNMALSVPVRVTSERPDTRALPPAR